MKRMNWRSGWRRMAAMAALGAAGTWGAAAGGATLDVELDVRTRVEAGSAEAKRSQDVVILVVDRSGSMGDSADAVGRPNETREAVMREMLRDRLEMLSAARPNAEVWTVLFANEISPFYGPYSPKDEKGVFGHLGEPRGCTLLYDAMERAVLFGEERMKRDPAARIWLYFYSDGENYYEPGYTYWVETREERVQGLFGERTVKKDYRIPFHYMGPKATAQFKKDYESRIQAYADAGKMSLETGCWLGEGKPPVMIENKRKDEYPLELTADGTSLKNPAAAPSQGLKARLLVPLPERYVKDLEGAEARMVFEAAGRREMARLPLAPGRKTVRLKLPDGLPPQAFAGQLRVAGLPDLWKSVALAEPEPVELSFADPGALSLSGVTPRGERWTATGTPVEFSATATEGAEVTWSVDGKEAGKGTFEKTFGRPGTYKAVATAQKAGFRPATAECTIHAVDTAVTVESPSGARAGMPVSFEAKSAGGESVSWWVDGQPAEGQGARLEGWTFDESGHHTAKARVYFGHGLSGEGEAHFEVSVAPHVAIDTPWSGEEFGFGDEIKAVAKVEGDFERVVWTLRGPDAATNEAEVDREARESRPAAFKPGKGGTYELTAAAEGPAGRVESRPVSFKVAREDAWVRIEEPASGSSVQTGKDMVLRASARGEEATSIKWTVADSAGNEVFSATRPTEGGVSQCAFRVPETLGNGTMLYVGAEAADDPTLRAGCDVETRCANCAAMGATLSLSLDGKEGRTFGRGEKIVAELKDLQGEVRDIEWTFGDAGRALGRVAEWGGWTEYNVYPVRAAGRCGKCGAVRDFGLESVIIERRPVSAEFAVAERGSYYTAGGKLHLTCTGGGDIADYVWTVDGEELADFRGKREAVVELPFKACDPVLRLTVRGMEGGEEDTCERGVRVRFGWVAALLFLLAALLVLWPLGMLLTGNGPSGWGLKAWVAPEPELDADGKEAEKATARQRSRGKLPPIRKHWHMSMKRGEKHAVIPLSSLVAKRMSDLLGVREPAKENVIVKPDAPVSRKIQGLPSLRCDIRSFPPQQTLETETKRYYLFYPSPRAQQEAKARGEDVYCLRIVLDCSRDSLRHAAALFLLAAVLLGAVVWASLRYAI